MLDQNIHLSPRQAYSLAIGQYLESFMGRSFLISLVTKSRIGASLNLSRRLCGSGAGDDVPFGQSRCFEPQRKAEKSRDYSGLKAVLPYTYALADGSSYDCSTAFNFEISKHTLQLRGGSGVDAPRPLYLKRRCGGYKEM